MPKRYKDEFAEELDKEFGFKGDKGWFRVDVPRKSSEKKASDPYWFHPDGWRFRSRSEVARWREADWAPSALQHTAFVVGKEPYDGMGISKTEAVERGLIDAEEAPAGKTPKSTSSSSSSKTPTSASAAAAAAASTGRRARESPTSSSSSSAAAAAASAQAPSERGAASFGKSKKGNAAASPTASSSSASMRTVVAYAKPDQPVLSLFQKESHLADVRITHTFGSPIADASVPRNIYFFQRTFYESVDTNIRRPYLRAIGDYEAAEAHDEDSEPPPVEDAPDAVIVMRAETIPQSVSRSESSNAAPDATGLSTLFSILCSKDRVGLAQTALSLNQQIFLVPPFHLPAGVEPKAAAPHEEAYKVAMKCIEDVLDRRTKGRPMPPIASSGNGGRTDGDDEDDEDDEDEDGDGDSESSGPPTSFYLLCILRGKKGFNLRTTRGMGESGSMDNDPHPARRDPILPAFSTFKEYKAESTKRPRAGSDGKASKKAKK